MKKLALIIAALLLAAVFPAAAESASLQTSLIPADAKWQIHIDVGRLAATRIKDLLLGESSPGPGQAIRRIEKIVKIDFFKDISAITIIGLGTDENEAVVAFSGKIDKKYLLTLLSLEASPEEISYGKHTIYRWENDKFGVFAADQLTLVGGNRSGLEKVLDTFDGKIKSAAQDPTLPAKMKEASVDSFIVAATDDLSAFVKNDPKASMILKKTGAAVFQARELNGFLKLSLTLQSDSSETAANLAKVLDGLLTMISLRDERDRPSPQIDLLKSLKISTEGSVLRASLETSSENLAKGFLNRRTGSFMEGRDWIR